MRAAARLRWDRVSNLDQVAAVVQSNIHDGRAHGSRAIDVRVIGGIDLRLLPDRGLDIGGAWYRGLPLAWISPLGEARPLDTLDGDDWLAAFGGGLVTTCGLFNVGTASEGHGLHGGYSHQAARDVAITRRRVGGRVEVTVTGIIEEGRALGPLFRLERRITTWSGNGRVEIEDRTTNIGPATEPAPILYHVNIGYPMLDSGSRIVIDADEIVPRDASAQRSIQQSRAPGPPSRGAAPLVFEHRLSHGARGTAAASIVNDTLGLLLKVSWSTSTLPRLHQWLHPAAGIYALAFEPANCSVEGRSEDRARGQLTMLEPGASRTTRVHIEVHEVPASGS